MFEWLQETSLAYWVGGSLWAYPFLLSLHAVGLAVVVGIFTMRDLRLLGLFSGLDPAVFLSLSKLAAIGFVINAISGLLLFTSQAVTFVGNTPFLLKLVFITTGMILAVLIQSRLRNELAGSNGEIVVSGSTKVISSISIFVWMAAIVAGRLIAYL